MIKILLAAIAVLVLALGLSVWRIDNLSGQNELLVKDVAAAVATAESNAKQVKKLETLRARDNESIGRLQRRYEDLHTDNLNLREILKNEEDGPTAPVLKCAVDRRLCQSSSGNESGDNATDASSEHSSVPGRTGPSD